MAFRKRAKHFVPLALYKYLADLRAVPESMSYLDQQHLDAIKAMPLINKGRLSVQPCSQVCAADRHHV